MASPFQGPAAIRALPIGSDDDNDDDLSLETYVIPSRLRVSDRKAMRDSGGVDVSKVSKTGKLQPRRLAISPDCRQLFVTTNRVRSVKGLLKLVNPSNTKDVTAKRIDVGSIVKFHQGPTCSARLRMAQDVLPPDAFCLCIVYCIPSEASSFATLVDAKPNFGPHRLETLDVVVSNKADYELLVTTLQDLLTVFDKYRQACDVSVLALEQDWMQLDRELIDARVSPTDWMTICERRNVPVKKPLLTGMYKDFARFHNVEEEGLTLDQTAELLKEVQAESLEMIHIKKDPMDRLWDEMVLTDPVPVSQMDLDESDDLEVQLEDAEESISAVAFLSFIRSQQKEFTYSLEHVHQLIATLNRQIRLHTTTDTDDKQIQSSERLSRTCFRSYLVSGSNDWLDPKQAKVASQDMTRPLNHYWINTSHDTYLSVLPDNAFAASPSVREIAAERQVSTDVQSYCVALERGVRAMELDTWDSLGGKGPVVARRKPTGTHDQGILFADVLEAVRAFLKAVPESTPIILLIENHCSLENQAIMADDVEHILKQDGLLYEPPNLDAVTSMPLPSPEFLEGKVVLKSKRPAVIKKGATIMNDDFDDEIDVNPYEVQVEEEDEGIADEASRIVTGFSATGPVRTISAAGVPRLTPAELLKVALDEADEARREAHKAKGQAEKLTADAAAAEELAVKLAEQALLTPNQVRTLARQEVDASPASATDSTTSSSPREGAPLQADHEGVEVHDFFENGVQAARSSYSTADKESIDAALKEKLALQELNKARDAYRHAAASLETLSNREKEVTEASRKAAMEARANREHADTARKRVDTVKDMLRQSRSSSSSAETVVVTASTEAKISEQRASETEARASRAMATAEADRARADEETRKEEHLEEEATKLHSQCLEATRDARVARDRVEKAAAVLERVNEQIKLIEGSTGYQKELLGGSPSRASANPTSPEGSRPRHVTNVSAKHVAKLEERRVCTEGLKAASDANKLAERLRCELQDAMDDKARAWKKQADIASKARKHADRSSHIAEELAEQAEEEREAATLRQVAREKALKNVEQSDSYQISIQAQLAEAERASTEAARLALDSRQKADRLAMMASKLTDHSDLLEDAERCKEEEEAARDRYKVAKNIRAVAETKALDAKRLLSTSTEVYSNAQRDAAEEVHRTNLQLQAEKYAVSAYTTAIVAREAADEAVSKSKIAALIAAQKDDASKQARAYKERTDQIVEVNAAFASFTLLHSCKHKFWEKSFALPSTHMHSFAQGMVLQRFWEEEDHDTHGALLEFTQKHMCRTFPSWKVIKAAPRFNYDPVPQWAAGCQLVSMNYHAVGEHLLLNDGRFRQNGSCGYVLKPKHLLDSKANEEREEHWKFEVLCGSNLPKPESRSARKRVNPFVKVALYDGISDSDSNSQVIYTTRPCERNSLNPVWHEDKPFDVHVKCPSVAMLLISVWDGQGEDGGEFIAAASVPVSCLRAGYRSVALFDSKFSRLGPYMFASLFVRVQRRDD